MNRTIKITFLSAVYAFLYLPILIIIWFSFNNTRFSLLWHGFTWHWYHVLLQDNNLIQVTLNSLVVSFSAATIATLLGALASITLFRYRFLGKSLLQGLLFILIIIPDIVVAIALLLFYRSLHFPLGFTSLLLAHITFCMPFVFIVASTRLVGFDRSIIEAAKDVGAKETTILWRILLPQIGLALIAGWLLSFTLSLDDVIISFFVTGPSFEILPLKIYSMVRLGISPEINALCSVLFILTLTIVTASQILLRKR